MGTAWVQLRGRNWLCFPCKRRQVKPLGFLVRGFGTRRPKVADSAIDFSDIPELTGKFWENAVRNPFYRPVKKQLTLRLDADVIFWLR